MLNDIALCVQTSELRNITCHMGSHGVTCHPTQVNVFCITSGRKADTRSTYPGGMEGWVDLINTSIRQVYLHCMLPSANDYTSNLQDATTVEFVIKQFY